MTLLRTIPLGRFGSFYASELIGQHYGLTYEIVDKKLRIVPPLTIQEVGRMDSTRFLGLTLTRAEDTDATNEYINDGEFVQPLTLEEIKALKEAGVHSSVCIMNPLSRAYP